MTVELPLDKNEPYDINKVHKVVLFQGDNGDIELIRNKNYLNLYKKGEEDKRYYRYNLNTKKFERINFYKTVDNKITEVTVENARKWFSNCGLYTYDAHFGRLMLFAQRHLHFENYSNPVRFIEVLGHDYVKNLELWEALGIEISEVRDLFGKSLAERFVYRQYPDSNKTDDQREKIYSNAVVTLPWHSISIKYAPSECSKPLLNYIKNIEEPISCKKINRLVDKYNTNEFQILQNLIQLNNTDEFYRLFCENEYCYLTGDSFRSRNIRDKLIELIKRYNLDLISLCKFFKKQKNIEKNTIEYLISRNHYADYLRMEFHLRDGRLSKMVKYPVNFRTTFHQVEEEYMAIKARIDAKEFKKISEENQALTYVGKKYTMMLPTKPRDIEIEANELQHCVRTYIPIVLKRETLIMFLRDKKYPKIPLVTVEVKNGRVTQAYGKHDSKPSEECIEFLRMWAKKKNLKMACWRK